MCRKDVLEELDMQLRTTLFAVVVVIVDLVFGLVAHTEAVLPDLACLALHHELAGVGVVL